MPSLVGSEMCIRDRPKTSAIAYPHLVKSAILPKLFNSTWSYILIALDSVSNIAPSIIGCLLYTSDAADDLLCVDLGGRRIIKKKTIKKKKKRQKKKNNKNRNEDT